MNIKKPVKPDEHLEFQIADLIMDLIPKLMQVMREEMRHGRGEHLTVPQFRLLAAVNRGIVQNRALAEHFGVSEAGISRMIDVLVAEELIKKSISKTDRRQIALSLTKDGQTFYLKIRNDALLRIKNKVSSINLQEQLLINSGLESLQKNIAKF